MHFLRELIAKHGDSAFRNKMLPKKPRLLVAATANTYDSFTSLEKFAL
jgi:hypothetical protein